MTCHAALMESNRDYIIAEFTGRRGRRRSAENIAKEFGVGRKTLQRYIQKWREQGLLEYMGNGRLEQDRGNIEALYLGGMAISTLAGKFGVDYNTTVRALERWGIHDKQPRTESRQPPKISLADLKLQWVDITEKMVVTVNRKPMFYLVPIGREEV